MNSCICVRHIRRCRGHLGIGGVIWTVPPGKPCREGVPMVDLWGCVSHSGTLFLRHQPVALARIVEVSLAAATGWCGWLLLMEKLTRWVAFPESD